MGFSISLGGDSFGICNWIAFGIYQNCAID
jgi:hypothetical protein